METENMWEYKIGIIVPVFDQFEHFYIPFGSCTSPSPVSLQCEYTIIPELKLLPFMHSQGFSYLCCRMVLRDRRKPYVIPRSCGGRMSCVFLVFVPMLGALALAGLWIYKTKQVSTKKLSC